MVRRAVLGTAAAGALTLALALSGGVAANAAPYNCRTQGAGNWSRSALCLSGQGSYRVAIFCENPLNIGGSTVYGPWMSGGWPSGTTCAWYQHVGSAWVQTS